MSAPEAGVVAAALVSLFEVAAALPGDDDDHVAEALVELGADLGAQVADGEDRRTHWPADRRPALLRAGCPARAGQ